MLPGTVFERPSRELTARISYINFAGAKSLAASETIALHQELPEEFINSQCGETLEGIQTLIDWLTD
jgi:aspartate aminotransferase